MKKFISILICAIFLAGCAPSDEAIKTAIAQTQTAMPTNILFLTPTAETPD